MTQQTTTPELKTAIEAFMPKVEHRLHAWVKELHDGKPAVTCIWNEDGKRTMKEIVYVGAENGFDARGVARTLNKSMKADGTVVEMLLQLYQSHNNKAVGMAVEY
jgi:hypothetical protein